MPFKLDDKKTEYIDFFYGFQDKTMFWVVSIN